MYISLDRNLEEEKQELLSKYNEDELQLFQRIIAESCFLVSRPIIVESRSEVGTDGK